MWGGTVKISATCRGVFICGRQARIRHGSDIRRRPPAGRLKTISSATSVYDSINTLIYLFALPPIYCFFSFLTTLIFSFPLTNDTFPFNFVTFKRKVSFTIHFKVFLLICFLLNYRCTVSSFGDWNSNKSVNIADCQLFKETRNQKLVVSFVKPLILLFLREIKQEWRCLPTRDPRLLLAHNNSGAKWN